MAQSAKRKMHHAYAWEAIKLLLYRKQIGFILIVWMIVSSCGYRFPGEGDLPFGVRRVFVVLFQNRTAETGIENVVTNDVKQEFIRNRKDVLADSSADADARLSGVVESIREDTVSRKGTHTPLERRVVVTVSLTLTSPDGRVMWSGSGISENEAFAVASDSLGTEQNRQAALYEVSKKLAERIYNRLTDDF